MRNVSLDVSKLKGFINEHEIGYMGDMVNSAHNAIHNGTGAGNDFLGWLDLPKNYDREELKRYIEENGLSEDVINNIPSSILDGVEKRYKEIYQIITDAKI